MNLREWLTYQRDRQHRKMNQSRSKLGTAMLRANAITYQNVINYIDSYGTPVIGSVDSETGTVSIDDGNEL